MAGRPPLALRIVSFDEETFVAEVRAACGAEPLGEAEEIPRQIRYLTRF